MSNPIAITKRNVDKAGNTVAVKVYETKKITDGLIALKQIPDLLHRVNIENYIEVDEDKLGTNEFRVDYSQGIVYFNTAAEGEFVDLAYYGIGYELIHVSRIFTDSQNGVVETLEELIENINNAIATKGIIKENYKTTVLANQFTYNSNSELYEYTLKHNLNSNKINVGVFDMNNESCLDLCKPIDSNTLLVRNDERVDLKIVINYGSVK